MIKILVWSIMAGLFKAAYDDQKERSKIDKKDKDKDKRFKEPI